MDTPPPKLPSKPVPSSSSPPTYKARLRTGSLRDTTKKMMAKKTSGAPVTTEGVKRFLKEDKGLRRMAYGQDASTIESWKGRHFIKEAKEKLQESDEFRQSYYGQKTSAGKAYRDTMKQEIREDVSPPSGPNPKELAQQKKIEARRAHARQFEQARMIERESGQPLAAGGAGGAHPADATSAGRAVPLSGTGGMASVGKKLPDSGPGGAKVFAGSGALKSSSLLPPLPPRFGLRGRILRIEGDTVLVHILNAPPELAIFIGRDRNVRINEQTVYWTDHHTVPVSELHVGNHADIRGRITDEVFTADEVFLNNADLPDFVVRLDETGDGASVPTETPPDLPI